jgi:glucosamine--fructose-6-phosphate aminotransferase (isomerizing)
LFLLGRGASLASVFNGALVLKEAAKFPAIGISSAQFRHGPFELVDPHLCAAIFAGEGSTRILNLNLGADILRRGGRVFWIDAQPAPGLPAWQIPAATALDRSILEILPVQVLSIALAQARGFIPGSFRHLGKVVLEE